MGADCCVVVKQDGVIAGRAQLLLSTRYDVRSTLTPPPYPPPPPPQLPCNGTMFSVTFNVDTMENVALLQQYHAQLMSGNPSTAPPKLGSLPATRQDLDEYRETLQTALVAAVQPRSQPQYSPLTHLHPPSSAPRALAPGRAPGALAMMM